MSAIKSHSPSDSIVSKFDKVHMAQIGRNAASLPGKNSYDSELAAVGGESRWNCSSQETFLKDFRCEVSANPEFWPVGNQEKLAEFVEELVENKFLSDLIGVRVATQLCMLARDLEGGLSRGSISSVEFVASSSAFRINLIDLTGDLDSDQGCYNGFFELAEVTISELNERFPTGILFEEQLLSCESSNASPGSDTALGRLKVAVLARAVSCDPELAKVVFRDERLSQALSIRAVPPHECFGRPPEVFSLSIADFRLSKVEQQLIKLSDLFSSFEDELSKFQHPELARERSFPRRVMDCFAALALARESSVADLKENGRFLVAALTGRFFPEWSNELEERLNQVRFRPRRAILHARKALDELGEEACRAEQQNCAAKVMLIGELMAHFEDAQGRLGMRYVLPFRSESGIEMPPISDQMNRLRTLSVCINSEFRTLNNLMSNPTYWPPTHS
ncbi:MAG: hypothetical protein KDD42_09410 [Bdellovibrionales bacterium]|nr:hypothetical protein [Bdellovibrionales bacterium]